MASRWTVLGRAEESERLVLLGIGVAFVVTRVAFVVVNPPAVLPLDDQHGYLLIAREFGDWLLHGNAVRGPLYPGVLAALGSSPRAGQFGNVVIELGAAAILVWTARRLWGSAVGIVTALLWTLYVPFIYYDAMVETEMVGVLLFTAVASCLLVLWHPVVSRRPGRVFALLGVLMGLEELLRPSSGRLLLLAALVVLVRHGPPRKALALATVTGVAFLLTVSPWLYRNVEAYGTPVSGTFSTSWGLLTGVPPKSLIAASPVVGPMGEWKPLGQFYSYPFVPGVSNAKRHDFWARDDLKEGRYYRRVFWSFMTHEAGNYKGQMLGEHLLRPFQLWGRSSIGTGEHAVDSPRHGSSLLWLWRGWHLVVVAAGILAFARLGSLWRELAPWVALALVFTVALALAAPLQGRYMLPMMPLVLATCALALAHTPRAPIAIGTNAG